MDVTVVVVLIALAAVVGGVVAWLVSTAIVVQPGTIALLLKRGKPTGRSLAPGRHFVEPWKPLTIQTYPSRELCLVAGGRGVGDHRVEYVDDPLHVVLGDRCEAWLHHTVRCRLNVDRLVDVHENYGPEGLWPVIRDTVRGSILGQTERTESGLDEIFGSSLIDLETQLRDALEHDLAQIGLILTMFTLREVDLGGTDEVIQSTVRARAELEREQAMADVRRARLENDAALAELTTDDAEVLLRYRQIEAWRDVLLQWDGDRPVPAVLSMPLLSTPPIADESDRSTDDDDLDAATDTGSGAPS